MQLIELIYNSKEIEPSVYILLYMRLIGIYVYETFIDCEKEIDSLFEKFTTVANRADIKANRRKWESDAQFYLIKSNSDYKAVEQAVKRNGSNLKKYVIMKEEEREKYSQIEGIGETIQVIVYKSREDLLNQMIEVLEDDSKEKQSLKDIADIYNSCQVWELHLSCKYFYAAQEKGDFERKINVYVNIVNKLIDVMEDHKIGLGEASLRYLQYAICNLAYETNLYCIKTDKFQVYEPESIVTPLSQLLLHKSQDEKFKDSIQMLLAQVYDDLMKKPNKAFPYYLEVCKQPYNAYAYFRKAGYWKNFGQDNDRGILYYFQSAVRYPYYYRAWFNLGLCYAQKKDYRKSLYAFRNVKLILRNRRRNGVLRPIEFDYLYRAYCCSGYLWYNFLGDMYMAVREDIEAVKIWDEIDKSKFYSLLGNETKEQTVSILKERLNVLHLYEVIYKLANKLKENYLVEKYNRKIQEVKGQDEQQKISN